jgi:hypothetical protein
VTGGEPTLTVPEREEVAVPVVLVHEGVTQDQYEEPVRRLAGKERMESPADWPVPGLLAHISGQGEKGIRVVDVWESQEAVDAFAAQLMPILEEIGVQGRPRGLSNAHVRLCLSLFQHKSRRTSHLATSDS